MISWGGYEWSDKPEKVRVKIGLSLDVRRLLNALALPEKVLALHASEQEEVFTWETELVVLIGVIVKFDGTLSECASWC